MLMSMKISFAAASLVILSLSAFALGGDAKKEIQANYDAISKAFVTKDIDGLSKFYAPDFVAREKDGTTTPRERVIADFTRQMNMLKEVSWVKKIVKLTQKGDEATVTVKGNFKGKMPGQDGKSHPFTLQVTAEDVWVKGSAGWLLKSTLVLDRAATIDGKPMGGK